MSVNAAGLDFGTSNSAISIVKNGQVELVEIQNEQTMPTTVFIDLEGRQAGKLSFGNRALDKAYGKHVTESGDVIQGDRSLGKLIRGLKSLLGTSTIELQLRLRDDTGYNHCFMFTEFIEKILTELKTAAEAKAGGSIDNVVMGRPVRFVDFNDEQDKQAEDQLVNTAKKVGFKEVQILFEPIAAALSYEAGIDKEKLAVVLDVGGGTTDVSLIRLSPKRHHHADREADILANAGVHIGGMDFDARIALEKVAPALGDDITFNHDFIPRDFYHNMATWPLLSRLYNRRTLKTLERFADKLKDGDDITQVERFLHVVEMEEAHILLGAIEEAKISLNKLESVQFDFSDCFPQSLHPDITMTKTEMDDSILADKFNSITKTILTALKDAQISASDVDTVFLTGGPSAMPAIKQIASSTLVNAQLISGNRLSAVGQGLGIAARNVFEL